MIVFLNSSMYFLYQNQKLFSIGLLIISQKRSQTANGITDLKTEPEVLLIVTRKISS